ncbi:Secreted protein containing C-terminal beta-propeller domain [Desulfotomaculum arcticum]|uniref:Secreted protein containing C-terminal beta-propeller domain n=1 Tax=Desulfotruncus arcticus DSM 17038 TaxID=1121424 RepID=A0A1I2TPR0_9FIRM|nr:beta-propeller domain-containing protein [Desulfotruncus arcticus]SFG66139.1 Secreted protein containing C-terminal beta-propeller domain [Desulfotomaculum arcticum] [Desulfotruncus arcticus DSM 17038]
MFRGKLICAIAVICVFFAAVAMGTTARPEESAAGEPATFASLEELSKYIKDSTEMVRLLGIHYGIVDLGGALEPARKEALPETVMIQEDKAHSTAGQDSAPGFSGTNNQVTGVDEADLVKTDGTYLYIINGQKLNILLAYPADQARQLSEILFKGNPVEVFINGDCLVVFGNGPEPNQMFTRVYDITNRNKPVLQKDITSDGYYVTARMIGNFIYAVNNAPVFNSSSSGENDQLRLPRIFTDGKQRIITPQEIYYFDCQDYSYRYTTVLAINLQNNQAELQTKTFLTGTSQNVYASTENLYLTGNKMPDLSLHTQRLWDGLASVVPETTGEKIRTVINSGDSYWEKLQQVEFIIDDCLNSLDYVKSAALEEKVMELKDKWQRDIAREQNNTAIYKLAITHGQVNYKCSGTVGGQLLNQFSMDEYNGYFRIATTSQGFLFTGPSENRNNLYVLDDQLRVKGDIRGLAPSERIYSARFMGDRAYLVTFRQVDPLFVIDLKDPSKPKVMGELKIPGYSNYLQPYDENHLIGIGREISAEPQPLVDPKQQLKIMPPPAPTRERGVKIALFDVSNPATPKEISKYVVERDDSDSLALRDHRAVLFSKDKNLLVIPMTYRSPFRIMESGPQSNILPDYQGWQGAFIFDISTDNGIKYQGMVEHLASNARAMWEQNPVKRSLYINEVLYTISDRMIKLNSLENLQELKTINLN